MNNCAKCGGKLADVQGDPFVFKTRGLEVTLLGVPRNKCLICGEEFVTVPNVEQLHRRIGLDICTTRMGLLLPAEIRFLRQELSFNGDEMAQVLGVTSLTLSKWEHNKRPISESCDRLLRSIYLSCNIDVRGDKTQCEQVKTMFLDLPIRRNESASDEDMGLKIQHWSDPDQLWSQ